jgi:hypothetical protein
VVLVLVHPPADHPARAPPARHPAPARRRPRPAHPRQVQRARRLHIYRALFGLLHGHVLNELQELIDNADETDDLLRLGLHRLPIGELPLLRSLATVLASYDGAAELERGFGILLAGLTTTLPLPGGDYPRPARAHQPGPASGSQ